MSDVWTEPWFVPALLVVVGLPVVLVVLTEVHSSLLRRNARGTGLVLLLRNYVAPVGALLLLISQTTNVGNTELTWPRIVATVFGFLVILVLLGGLNLALFVTARTGTWRSRMPSIFVEVVRVILIVVSLGVLFSVVWHADVGGLFAALGVGSIVIGLALQNAVGSVISGLLLLFEQPFGIGDWLVVNGTRGRVVEVNWRAVHLHTSDGVIVVPNSSLAASSFLNLSRSDSPFESSAFVRFGTDDPPQEVMDVCEQTAASLPMIALGTTATVSALGKGKYEVDIPINSPADNAKSLRMFYTRLWYASRRAGLHLDRDQTDPFQTPERRLSAIRTFAAALYLTRPEADALAESVRIERYGEGEVIQRPLVVPDAMRYIISGTASLTLPVDGGDVVIATLSHAGVLGLTALTRQAVATTATAVVDVAVLVVPVGLLDTLVTTRPDLARDIGVELDHRRAQAVAALGALGIATPTESRMIA